MPCYPVSNSFICSGIEPSCYMPGYQTGKRFLFNSDFAIMKKRVSKIIAKTFGQDVLVAFNVAWDKGHTYTGSVENHLNLINSFVRVRKIDAWVYAYYLSEDFRPKQRKKRNVEPL